jgi:predicted nucleic acid-binding protein
MNYIIDSCVWIDYFNKKLHYDTVSQLLTDNLAYINKIILAELIPSARIYKEFDFITCLSGLNLLALDIDWDEIIEIQHLCIKSGINKLGLLDIVIAQNAKQNDIGVFSTDKHMILLSQKLGINYTTGH